MTRIRLDLSRHCIETEIKKIHNVAVSDYFKSGTDKHSIEETLQLTQKALQTLNFPRLRSAYPALAGHSTAQVFLEEEAGSLSILLDQEFIKNLA